jgi:RNA polymerase sigma-70 factor (ECF subfamily)
MHVMSSANHKDGGSVHFATTQWSLIIAAGQRSSRDSRAALAALCETYWRPLYAYARRRTPSVHDAQDQTQEFFVRLLEKDLLSVADPTRGRFRSFLLTSFKNFLSNEWDKAQAKKRGGGKTPISLDFVDAESRYSLEACADMDPEAQFEKQWILQVLDLVLERLHDECTAAGKAEQFDALKDFITGLPVGGSYSEAALRLGVTENAVQVAAHRLRHRYRELLREEISRTVAEPADVDDEIRCLVAVLGR